MDLRRHDRGRHLKVKLEGFLQVLQRLLDGRALAGNVDAQRLGDEPVLLPVNTYEKLLLQCSSSGRDFRNYHESKIVLGGDTVCIGTLSKIPAPHAASGDAG